jgi:4-amino-4-deoxy-L-arabinose transferase-like glycosyltransferase
LNRYIVACFGILSCLLVFIIGRSVSNIYTAVTAALLMAYNSLMIECSSRVWVDSILLFLSVSLYIRLFCY